MRRSLNRFMAAVLPVVTQASFQGDGTTYSLGNLSGGNCNFMSHPEAAVTKYAAINAAQWESTMSCGRCAQVTCIDDLCANAPQESEVVYIVDQCPGCLDGDLDLSSEVFESITGLEPARVKIEWSFVDCPVQGNIEYCLKTGSNPFWTAIQPTNFVSGVKSLMINDKSVDLVESAFYFLLDGNSENTTDLSSVKISMVSVDGDEVTDTVSFESESCAEGASQFGGSNGGISTSTVTSAALSTSAPSTPTPTTSTPNVSPTLSPYASAPASVIAAPQQMAAPAVTTSVAGSVTLGPSQTATNAAASLLVDAASSSSAQSSEINGHSTKASGSSSAAVSTGSGGESSGDGFGSVAGTTSSPVAETGVDPSSPTLTPSPGNATVVSTATGGAGLNATTLVASLAVLVVIAFGIMVLLIITVRKKACPEKMDDRMSDHSDLEHGQATDASGVFSAASTPTSSRRLA